MLQNHIVQKNFKQTVKGIAVAELNFLQKKRPQNFIGGLIGILAWCIYTSLKTQIAKTIENGCSSFDNCFC